MNEHHIDPDVVLAGLKDFQRRTARWAFQRMFDEAAPSTRFLVADEVGLGKTHVAKGVVAQVVDHLQRIGDRRQDIVYICSNAAIAQQNLRKLVPNGIDAINSVERLTMLPTVPLDDDGHDARINLLAITPGTSLNFGHRTGRFEERCLAYEFLRQLWGNDVMIRRARWIFRKGIEAGDPDQRLRDQARTYHEAVWQHLGDFEQVLDAADRRRAGAGEATTREMFDELVEGLSWQRSFPSRLANTHMAFIAEIRRCMALVGIKSLEPDLVILDEFQRFKELLEPGTADFATELAHRLFDHQDSATGRRTRTLLLSATPYRMYSTADDLDSDHYDDFLATCRFLFDDVQRVDRLRQDLTALRRSLTDAETIAEAPAVCERISAELRTVMARTERLAATPDRDGMLVERATALTVDSGDITAYLRLGALTDAVGHHEPIEYWKSAPYLVNFMDRYQLKTAIAAAAETGSLPELSDSGPGLLDWGDITRYSQIDPQNGRLRWLLEDLHRHRVFELLWLPPSLRYYDTGSAYESEAAGRFTKRLIFSGWAVVPKAIASLVSYEAERVAYRHRRHPYDAGYRQRGANRLMFRMAERRATERRAGEADTERRAAAMTAFALTWPSPTLARLGDPRPTNGRRPDVADLMRAVSERVADALTPLTTLAPDSGAVDARWYWAAAILLDRANDDEAIGPLLVPAGAATWDGEAAGDGLRGHIAEAAALIAAGPGALGRVPEDLVDVVSEMAIGGPAVCALRAISAVTGLGLGDHDSIAGAARAGAGFRSFFNAPEVTSLILGQNGDDDDAETDGGGYWRSVVRHCIDGNLQALLDEHAHVLRDWRGYVDLTDDGRRADAAHDIATAIGEALELRTSTFNVDIPTSTDDSGAVTLDERSMRTRFAVAYGQQRMSDAATTRIGNVATAFNSPFWPFVLASTSVGQEGLDFHLWSHAVVHWNLPTNPVDLEQREGRVHRYKGHAVRRNIAATVPLEHVAGSADIWSALFAQAAERRGGDADDMVPYWVYPDGPHRIERLVPILPFSRDAAAFPRLRKTLAAYRLAFGQPRQEELIDYLGVDKTDDELIAITRSLRIDLSPPLEGL